MKILSIKSISAALFTSALLFTGCTDLTDGFSTDPVNITDPSVITTDKFLSGVETSLIGVYEADMNRLTGMWTGHFSGEDRQYIGLSQYGVSGRDFNAEWGGVYSLVLQNVNIVKRRCKVEKNTLMLGIAQTIQAMALGLAADLWGDVPSTEANQYPTIASPKFDDQLAVYARVQQLLDSAIANLALEVPDKLVTFTGDADFYFGGDPVKWTETANTLKARYFLHTRDYASAVTFAQAGISTGDNNMMAPHGTSYLQNFNLYYSFTNYDRPGYMAANGVAAPLMDPFNPDSRNNAKTNEATRFNYLYLNNYDGTYDLNYLFSVDYETPEDYDGFFGAATSFPLVTFEENQLILAESYIKQNDADNALTALNDLRAYLNSGDGFSPGYLVNPTAMVEDEDDLANTHMDPGFYLPYDLTDFDAGGIENADNIDRDKALLREILEERYVSLTGQLETFNDIRRTNNFLGIPVKSGSPNIPSRLLYPQSELNANTNVPKTGVGLFEPTKVNSTPY